MLNKLNHVLLFILWSSLTGNSLVYAVGPSTSDTEKCSRNSNVPANTDICVDLIQKMSSSQLACHSETVLDMARRRMDPDKFKEFENIYGSFFFYDPYQIFYELSLKTT